MKRQSVLACIALVAAAAVVGVRPATARSAARGLPPADPAWQREGWRAVAPHASVLRPLAAARERAEDGAPALFWLKGGTRVPVLEQRESWWRVGWTDGRSGWMRARDLEPHASFVFIDVRTGRVIRRVAAKGQGGVVADGSSLWTLSDTGITRMLPGTEPLFWSQAFPATRDDPLPALSAWSRDWGTLFVRTSESAQKMAAVDARTGAVRTLLGAGEGEITGVDSQGDVLIDQMRGSEAHTVIYDASRGAPRGEVSGRVLATSKTGAAYLARGPVLSRCGAGLAPEASVTLAGEVDAACLSVDERYVAVSFEEPLKPVAHTTRPALRILDAGTLSIIATLRIAPDGGGEAPSALVGDARGWVVVGGDEGGTHTRRYSRDGRPMKTWYGTEWAASRDGRSIYLSGEKELIAVSTADGKVRRIPDSWRRPLPARFLPKPADPEQPTHLEVSALSLTPDGRTLIVTEWLDGDPHG